MRFFPCIILLLLTACQSGPAPSLDHLTRLKSEFLSEVLQGSQEEAPFHFSYSMRTVFYSEQLISLFGELQQYTHLPHGWARYEGRTFLKEHGTFRSLQLHDLLSTDEVQEYVRAYCEWSLKTNPISYFSGQNILRTTLDLGDLSTFAIDDQSLIIIFQPYVVGGFADGPFIVKIPWTYLQEKFGNTHSFYLVLHQILASGNFISSWDKETEI